RLWPGRVLSFLRAVLFAAFFFCHGSPTTAIYTLSLHDALPICRYLVGEMKSVGALTRTFITERPTAEGGTGRVDVDDAFGRSVIDRKSTRLNSSHVKISYAVFCLKKKTVTHTNKNQVQMTTSGR